MAARHGLALEGPLASDVAPLNGLVRAALARRRIRHRGDEGPDARRARQRAARDGRQGPRHRRGPRGRTCRCPTRCGPRRSCSGSIRWSWPTKGKAVIGVRPDAADRVLSALRSHPLGRDAAIIGTCVEPLAGRRRDRHRLRAPAGAGAGRRAAAADLLRAGGRGLGAGGVNLQPPTSNLYERQNSARILPRPGAARPGGTRGVRSRRDEGAPAVGADRRAVGRRGGAAADGVRDVPASGRSARARRSRSAGRPRAGRARGAAPTIAQGERLACAACGTAGAADVG